MRRAIAAVVVGLVGLACAAQAQVALRDKKLIEYGWDVPTPAQMRDQRADMEKRPFDGLIFRLDAGFNAFVTKPLDAAKFEADKRILKDLRFANFRDNFVLIWGSPGKEWDWFSDDQWKAVETNARLLVRIARAGRVKGICFDPEPYDFSLWDHSKQARAMKHAFPEYEVQVRKWGAQLMRAFEREMPGALILTFFHVSLQHGLADLSPVERGRRLSSMD